MTGTSERTPVTVPVKDVALVIILVRLVTRPGINDACVQCPGVVGYGTGAFTAPGWRR